MKRFLGTLLMLSLTIPYAIICIVGGIAGWLAELMDDWADGLEDWTARKRK